MTGPVRLEVRDRVAVITLDRPEARNAIDLPTAEALSGALDQLETDPGLRAGVLAGEGPVFSAGMDLKAFGATGERPLTEARGAFGIVERPPQKPLVAAVEGKALGGGLEIALACDLIIAGEDAQFGLPEVRRGLVAAAGGVLRLPRRIPRTIAMELILTGEPIGAERAAALGLVNAVVRVGGAAARAAQRSEVIAGNAPMAVQAAKRLVDESADWPLDEAFSRQAPHTDAVRSSQDALEGARAFVEKRPPQWTGA